MYALLGRLLYEVGQRDNWQVLLFVKGMAGSGKSTIAKLIRNCYPSHLVGTLGSKMEETFGLSAIADKLSLGLARLGAASFELLRRL